MFTRQGVTRRGIAGVCLALLLALLPVAARPEAPLLVFAPSALADSFDDLVAAYADASGARPPRIAIGHSPFQARQIMAGSPADLFVSADPQWMDMLAAQNRLAADSVGVLATSDLVLIAPADSKLRWDAWSARPLAPLLGDGRLALTDPAATPLGRLARDALTALGVWDALESRLAFLDDNRAVAALVARGEAVAGVVYGSDVALEKNLRVVTVFPPSTHRPIAFPIAIVADHDRPDSRAFRQWLSGPAAQAILRRHGFTLP